MAEGNNKLSNNLYLLAGIALFLVEVLIALFMRDAIIRPYGGDFLAVIMLYCFARALLDWSAIWVALIVLGIAFSIELAQYIDLLTWLGWQKNTLARVVLGAKFEWMDMIAYTLGAVASYLLDHWLIARSLKSTE